jgi:response regulator RpfG family c-di-GMP phosphodiesterase
MEKSGMPIKTDDDEALMRQLYEWHMKMVEYHKELTNQHLERTKNFIKLVRERATTSLMSKDRNAG